MSKNHSTGIKRELANAPPVARKWLRPTFLVTRGTCHDFDHYKELESVYIAVLSVNTETDTATYEILGCPATPATIDRETLANLLRERGTKL